MKRNFFLALMAILTIGLFSGCNIQRNVTGRGLPTHVSHIEFWNGGTKIAEYNNAKLEILTYNSTGVVSYYIYSITTNGVTENIVDSEALAIKYLE